MLLIRDASREQNRLNILHGGTLACMVDLGGSLAVASRGLFATGVSTDLSGKNLTSLATYQPVHLRVVWWRF
jgi:acyl-coenzyme A thioesterase PaaI-like protein